MLQGTSKALPLALTERQERVDWDTAWPAVREPPFKDNQVVHAEALFESLRTARRVTDALMAKVGKLVRCTGWHTHIYTYIWLTHVQRVWVDVCVVCVVCVVPV